MAKHLIDLSQAARYAGNAGDITEITNGSPANADTFNAPPQDLRTRLEKLRQEVEDLKWTVDADRAMSLTVSGTLSVTDDSGYKLGLTTSGSLSIQPFNGKQSYATGTLTISSIARMTLTASSDATGPRGWGQYNDGFGPAERGANNIGFQFRHGTSLSAVVDADQVSVTIPSATLVSDVVTYLNSAETSEAYRALKIVAAAVSGQGSYSITLSSSPTYHIDVPLSGANEPSQATVTKAQLDAFFGTAANRLEDGDCLAIYFPETVSTEDGGVGRRQVITSTVLSGNLFNTRVEPSKIPLSLPIAVRRGTNVILCDGAMVPVDGSLANDRYLRTTGGTVTGDVDVTGTVGSDAVVAATVTSNLVTVEMADANTTAIDVTKDGDTTFKVDSDGDVTATSLTLGDPADAVPAGSLTVYNGTTNSPAISVRNESNVEFFKVDGDADVTIGANGENGTLSVVSDIGSTFTVLEAKTSAGVNLLKVTGAGDIIVGNDVSATTLTAASGLTISGVNVPAPAHTQLIFQGSTTWSVSATSGGTANTIATTVTAGTYLATLSVSLLHGAGDATGETDWCLLSSAEYTANNTRTPSQHATNGTAPYVSVHITNAQSSVLALTRFITLTTNQSVVVLGFISSGTGGYDARGALTLVRVA